MTKLEKFKKGHIAVYNNGVRVTEEKNLPAKWENWIGTEDSRAEFLRLDVKKAIAICEPMAEADPLPEVPKKRGPKPKDTE